MSMISHDNVASTRDLASWLGANRERVLSSEVGPRLLDSLPRVIIGQLIDEITKWVGNRSMLDQQSISQGFLTVGNKELLCACLLQLSELHKYRWNLKTASDVVSEVPSAVVMSMVSKLRGYCESIDTLDYSGCLRHITMLMCELGVDCSAVLLSVMSAVAGEQPTVSRASVVVEQVVGATTQVVGATTQVVGVSKFAVREVTIGGVPIQEALGKFKKVVDITEKRMLEDAGSLSGELNKTQVSATDHRYVPEGSGVGSSGIENFHSIGAWADEVFGPDASESDIASGKLYEEIVELDRAVGNYWRFAGTPIDGATPVSEINQRLVELREAVGEELADCMIMSGHLLRRSGKFPDIPRTEVIVTLTSPAALIVKENLKLVRDSIGVMRDLDTKIFTGPMFVQQGTKTYYDHTEKLLGALFNICRALGLSAQTLIDEKMEKNRRRNWQIDENGSGRHVKETSPKVEEIFSEKLGIQTYDGYYVTLTVRGREVTIRSVHDMGLEMIDSEEKFAILLKRYIQTELLKRVVGLEMSEEAKNKVHRLFCAAMDLLQGGIAEL
jgi:NTP pyrophosphatase (non-canonical NTP hydrolase)